MNRTAEMNSIALLPRDMGQIWLLERGWVVSASVYQYFASGQGKEGGKVGDFVRFLWIQDVKDMNLG